MYVKIFGQVFFADEEQGEDNVAEAAGDPDCDKQKESDCESLKDTERFGLCAQDVEQRGGHAEQDVTGVRKIGFRIPVGKADSKQCRKVDNNRHFNDAEVGMGVFHAEQLFAPERNEAVAECGDADRTEVADQDDGQGSGLAVAGFGTVVAVERSGHHCAEYNVHGVRELEQAFCPFGG